MTGLNSGGQRSRSQQAVEWRRRPRRRLRVEVHLLVLLAVDPENFLKQILVIHECRVFHVNCMSCKILNLKLLIVWSQCLSCQDIVAPCLAVERFLLQAPQPRTRCQPNFVKTLS